MNDKDLAAIEARDSRTPQGLLLDDWPNPWQDRRALLAEVKRLRDIFVLAGDEQTDLAAEVLRLREQRAEAWDEGLRAGKVLAAQAIGTGPVEHPTNPYRAQDGAA